MSIQESTKPLRKEGEFLAGNPLIADGGCIFNNGTISASFRRAPFFSHLIAVGQCVKIVVFNGDTATYNCISGQSVKQGDLSMRVTEIRQNSTPFEEFGLAGVKMDCP